MTEARRSRTLADLATRVPAWVWAAALLPRLLLFARAAADRSLCLRGDSYGYLSLARNLLHHAAFSAADGGPLPPETFRTPGYPLFLIPFVAIGHAVALAALAQCLLGALEVALAWTWYERIGGRRGAAAGALVLALDPVTVLHTPLILGEAIFGLLLVAATIPLWEADEESAAGRAAGCGLLWGLCALVKPIAVYLPPFLCWRWRRSPRALIAFLLAASILPWAWTVRNWERTGYAVYSSIGEHDLLRYPAAGVEALRTGRPWAELDAELRGRVDAAHPSGWANDAEKAQAYAAAASAILKAHPGLLVRYCAWGAVKILAGTGLELLLEWTSSHKTTASEAEFRPQASGQGTLDLLRRHPGLIPLQILYLAGLAALYALAAAGIRRLWTAGQAANGALLVLCLGYFLGLATSQGYYRYRIPLMPYLAAGAAAALGRKKS